MMEHRGAVLDYLRAHPGGATTVEISREIFGAGYAHKEHRGNIYHVCKSLQDDGYLESVNVPWGKNKRFKWFLRR